MIYQEPEILNLNKKRVKIIYKKIRVNDIFILGAYLIYQY